jgi:hypothetical protein
MTRRCRLQPACATPHATLDVPSNANANAAPTPTHLEHLVPWYRYCRCLRMPRRARSSKLLSATPSYPTTRIVPKVTTRSQSRRCAEEPGSVCVPVYCHASALCTSCGLGQVHATASDSTCHLPPPATSSERQPPSVAWPDATSAPRLDAYTCLRRRGRRLSNAAMKHAATEFALILHNCTRCIDSSSQSGGVGMPELSNGNMFHLLRDAECAHEVVGPDSIRSQIVK